MEPTQCSETSAFNTQMPGKYPEDNLSVIEFLVAESERPAYVHKRLFKAHSEVTVGLNTVRLLIRWSKEAETGRGEIHVANHVQCLMASAGLINRYLAIVM
jgi:hypothetical protein